MPRRTPPTAKKASESVVARMLAKLLRVPAADDIESVCNAYLDSGALGDMGSIITDARGLYPWVTNVARDIMSPNTTPLTEHLMSLPGASYFVKDTAFSGPESLWLAVGDPSDVVLECLRTLPHRGLQQTFRVGEHDTSHVIAIQISSCQV